VFSIASRPCSGHFAIGLSIETILPRDISAAAQDAGGPRNLLAGAVRHSFRSRRRGVMRSPRKQTRGRFFVRSVPDVSS